MELFWLWMLCIGTAVGIVAAVARRRGWSGLVRYLVLGLGGSIVGGSMSRAHSPSSLMGLIAGALVGAVALIVLMEMVDRE